MNFVHPTIKVEFYEIFVKAGAETKNPIQIVLFPINRSAQHLIGYFTTFYFDKTEQAKQYAAHCLGST